MTKKDLDRREFLKIAAAGLGSLAAIQIGVQTARSAEAARPGMSSKAGGGHSWAMVIDQSECNGCGACQKACNASNDINPDINWTQLHESHQVEEAVIYLPVPCMQCEHAPCVSVCPVKASYYRDDGIVMMDYDRCIGCRYCQVACPYGARSFNWEAFTGENPYVPEWGEPDVERRPRGVAEKCSFCYQRIDRGLEAGLTPGVHAAATPACVNTCPQSARIFGDLNDPNSNVSKVLAASAHYRLKENLGTSPRVYYLPATPGSKEA